jgi:hypothetical protein
MNWCRSAAVVLPQFIFALDPCIRGELCQMQKPFEASWLSPSDLHPAGSQPLARLRREVSVRTVCGLLHREVYTCEYAAA